MSAYHWYKRYPSDFISGTIGLTLEEKGAYSLCLDLMYDRAGPIPDDSRWLAGVCGCSIRKWNSIRESLVASGKLTCADGTLFNQRAAAEIENAAKTARKHAENGSKGGNKTAEIKVDTNENNNLGQARLYHTRYQSPDTRIEKKESAAGAVISSEDFFFKTQLPLAQKAGIARSRLMQFVKLCGGDYEAVRVTVAATLNAKQPSSYFGKVISNLNAERGGGPAPPKRDPNAPDFVNAARAEGMIVEKHPNGWKIQGAIYDAKGAQIGW